ncbi:ATP-binding cassette domain-containing protein [Fructilactobacillus sp. Tb1]|uniref:ABC transporter ATP-binding protein n=1 Tax=Fructilactobacillus sp. Tb1 TaxID=3422304 RepID=UPI003D2A56A4
MTVNLEVTNLVKKFGKFEALKGINLELNAGEVLGYIGPNGAGKSTTIRSILGILKPTSGSIKVFGKDAFDNAAEIHKRISYIPGTVYLWPNLTGGETIDMLLALSNQKHTAKTDQLIQDFHLDITKKNRDYSKGNLQKVALVATFSTDADLYIFDEPTSGLDPLNEDIFQQKLLDLKHENKSILLSSHILSEVERAADRIAVINDGQIIQSGTLEELQNVASSEVEVSTKVVADKLATFAGVTNLAEIKANSYSFKIKIAALEPVMTYLTGLGIINLSIQRPSLDELFLKYYNVKEVK